MSNLNYPLYGNQFYKSITAHATKSPFEPGCGVKPSSKLDSSVCNQNCVYVSIDLSTHYDPSTKQYVPGVGVAEQYIKLSDVPVVDPHSLITTVIYEGENTINDPAFSVEVGVMYGVDPVPQLAPSPATATQEYVQLSGFFPVIAGAPQILGGVPQVPGLNVGSVVVGQSPVRPSTYTGGAFGTPVLKIVSAQQPGLVAGELEVKVKWYAP